MNKILDVDGNTANPPKSEEDIFMETVMPAVIKEIMATAQKYNLNGWKYLAVFIRMLALGTAQQPRTTRPQVFKAFEGEVKHFVKQFHVAPSIIQPGEEG